MAELSDAIGSGVEEEKSIIESYAANLDIDACTERLLSQVRKRIEHLSIPMDTIHQYVGIPKARLDEIIYYVRTPKLCREEVLALSITFDVDSSKFLLLPYIRPRETIEKEYALLEKKGKTLPRTLGHDMTTDDKLHELWLLSFRMSMARYDSAKQA